MKKYYRITCFVPPLKFACDVAQLREVVKYEDLPAWVRFDRDGVSETEIAKVDGGEVSVWYEESK